jgi:protein TonB
MPERDLVIAAVCAALLHCGVAAVRAPALQPSSLSEDKTLEISIISEYKRNPKVSEVTVYETKKDEAKKIYDRKKVVLEKRLDKRVEKKVEKRAAVPAEVRRKADSPPESATAEMSEIREPLQAEGTGKRAEKIVTGPAIPCYKSNLPPTYPHIARRRGYEGEVLLSVMISVDGTVDTLKVKESSGYPILDRAAMKAVTAWKFEPARRMGIPVPLSVDIPVRFVLKRP